MLDELDKAKQRDLEFQAALMLQQEEDRDIEIENEREQLIVEGKEAQKKLQEQQRKEDMRADDVQQEVVQEETELEIQQRENKNNSENEEGEEMFNDEEALEQAKEIIQEGGHDISDEEVKHVVQNPPSQVEFPQNMLILAVIKDLLDVILTLTGVGIVVVFIYSLFYFIISIDWTLKRANKLGFAKKFVIRKLLNRMLLSSAAEVIPGLDVLPLATVFLLLNHYSEKRFVQLLIRAVEIAAKI